MTAGGVIPAPEEREVPSYVQTGHMDLPDVDILFGAEGHRVVIDVVQIDRAIMLGREDQDTFVRQLFRAITLAEQGTGPVEAPF